MMTMSPQAKKRRNRRLRHNQSRMVVLLYSLWHLVNGKNARIGENAVELKWETELQRHFAAERGAAGHQNAVDWLTRIVHAAASIDVHFQADLMAAAMSVGVYVPLKIDSVRTLGPGRRSQVVPNSTRVAWSRAS